MRPKISVTAAGDFLPQRRIPETYEGFEEVSDFIKRGDAITIGINLVNPLILERAINVNIANKDTEGLLQLGITAVVLNLFLILLIKLRMYLMAKLSNDVLLQIRQELYTHIQTLGFHFFDSRPTGKILARIIGDVNSLKDVLSNSVHGPVAEPV